MPDLWDDQARAQQVTSRLSYVAGRDQPAGAACARRLDDAACCSRWPRPRATSRLARRGGQRDRRADPSDRRAGDPHPALRRVRRPRGARHRSGPGPAASTRPTSPRCCCGCTCAGPSGTATRPRSTTPRTRRRPASSRPRSRSRRRTRTARSSVEQGTHRLVRISPFDNQGRRQTSFAGVEVVPVVEQTDHIEIPEDELRVDVYRSIRPGRPGRQHDRLGGPAHPPADRHRGLLPERAVPAAEQGQRDGGAPGASCSSVKRQEEAASWTPCAATSAGSWGDQMRSYVLHPYQMVKDLRTELRDRQPAAVFDGDIDGFIEAGIRWRKQRETGGRVQLTRCGDERHAT